jgi:molybdopterin molybdotransferase
MAAGAVLAEDIAADRDLPPFDRVTMDGFAVRSAEVRRGVRLRLSGSIAAGESPGAALQPGGCIAVTTGSPLPAGADCVIQHEVTTVAGDSVTFNCDPVEPFHNVHRRGADAARGETLLRASERLDPGRLAIAAAVGAARPLVRGGAPSVRVLSSGDEIRPATTPADQLAPHHIRDSNLHALAALIPLMGGRVESTRHVVDELAPTTDAVREGLREADVLVTIGGVSAGPRDHFPAAFRASGVTTIVRGVNLQPGKPILVGIAGDAPDPQRTIVIALPGNPVSVMVTAHLFLWPVLRLLSGRDAALPWGSRTLREAAQPNPRRESFRPAAVSGTEARVIAWSGSGDLVHLRHAGGVIRLAEQAGPVPAGAPAPFLPWAWQVAQGRDE